MMSSPRVCSHEGDVHCSVVRRASRRRLPWLYLADSGRKPNFDLPTNHRELREPPLSTENLPLTGVRVVEMTHMVMGPTCGMILAQLGAEVIKVEPPAGDKTRSLGGMGISFFPLFNRGKRSVVLDFAKPEDRETMHRLLASADVFLENFRDGQLEKQGLGAEELRRKHPHLIVAGHKGFLSGPYEHRPALDEVVQMMSGLAAMTGTSARPQRAGSSANDIMGGMFGALSILAALYRKRGAPAHGPYIRT